MKEKVLAKVADKEITQKDLDELLATMPPEYAAQMRQAGTPALLEEAINQELFYLDGLDRNLQESDVYKHEMQRLAKQLLRGVAINDILKHVQASEERMKEYYDSHRAEFFQEEQRGASHILVDSEEKAKELKERIQQGENFGDLAREHSSCPSSAAGGSLGIFGRGRMVPEFEEVAFQMQEGEVSNPVQTQFGYHLIKVDTVQEARELPFEEVKDAVARSLLNQLQQEAYMKHVESLRQKYAIVYPE